MRFRIATMLRIAAGVAIAGLVAWLSLSVHLKRACVIQDTPYLPLCGPAAAGADLQRDLRKRIAANPGDSGSWIRLTSVEQGEHEKALVRAAAALAPNDPNVLMWRTGEALAANQLPQAVALLVQSTEVRNQAEAIQALARILGSGQGTDLLRPHLPTARRWLPQVLASLAPLKLPSVAAQPLVAQAWASRSISRETLQTYIRSLKAEEQWVDAYGLWLLQQTAATPLIHNGRFDQPFQPDGFDWEVTPTPPSRTGAIVSQRANGNRGQVLDLEFTGKALPAPILRQHVFAPPGRYVLRGQFMGSRVRSEQGLAWSAICSNRKAAAPVAGRSRGLLDTGGAWQSFEFPVVISSDCGSVFSLQLEAFAPFEAASGLKGRMAFDALELVADRL